jgi:hypothetical protein
MLAMLLNTFQVDLQQVEPPFPDVRGYESSRVRKGAVITIRCVRPRGPRPVRLRMRVNALGADPASLRRRDRPTIKA